MFRHDMSDTASGVIIEHPNRDKAASKATKGAVILLLLVSVVLILIVTIGGWDYLVGAKLLQVFYMAIYLLMAYYVTRWNRGVLPVAAALAIILLIFALVAAPEWFDRDKEGFSNPPLDESVLGLITALLVPVQALLIVFAMRGFQQAWNVEVERYPDGSASEARA
jgi:small-conductance mechanosensitive channel